MKIYPFGFARGSDQWGPDLRGSTVIAIALNVEIDLETMVSNFLHLETSLTISFSYLRNMGSIRSNKWNSFYLQKILKSAHILCDFLSSSPPLPFPPLPSFAPINYCTVLNNANIFVIKDRYICPVVSNRVKNYIMIGISIGR